METDVRRRIVCLVYPVSCNEESLLKQAGSIGIIAAEQYMLMRQFMPLYDIVLYVDELDVCPSDVLFVMTCLPLVPVEILTKFEKIVYFFDDINIWRLKDEGYASKLKYCSAIFHPVERIALALDQIAGVPSFYVPWSLARIPQSAPPKGNVPSVFVDMDDRLPESVDIGATFIGAIYETSTKIYLPEKYVNNIPDFIRQSVTPVPFIPHDEFLHMLGGMWFYASGIAGSYEFPGLEASFMGCGLISLNSALNRAHIGGTFFLDIDFTSEPISDLNSLIENFDAAIVASQAHERYPQDYAKEIPALLQKIFEGGL